MNKVTRNLYLLRMRILEEDILPKITHIKSTPFYARSNTRKLVEPFVSTLIYLGGLYYLLFILHPVGASSVLSLTVLRNFFRTGKMLRLVSIVVVDIIGVLLLLRAVYIVILFAVRLPLNLLIQQKPELSIDRQDLDFRLLCRADSELQAIEGEGEVQEYAVTTGSKPHEDRDVVSSAGTRESVSDQWIREKHAKLQRVLVAVFPDYPRIREEFLEQPDRKVDMVILKLSRGFGAGFLSKEPRPATTSTAMGRRKFPGTRELRTSPIVGRTAQVSGDSASHDGGSEDDEEEEKGQGNDGPKASSREARAARARSAHRSGVTARKSNPSSASGTPEGFPTTTTISSSSSPSSSSSSYQRKLASTTSATPAPEPSAENKPQISSTLRKFINYTKNNRHSPAHIRYTSAADTMTKDLPEHAYIRPLTIHDLDQVEALENEGFAPEERASREKLAYRLKTCPELCAGIFVREFILPTEEYRNPTFENLNGNVLHGLGLSHQYDPINAATAAAASSDSTDEHLSLDLQSLKKAAHEVTSTPVKETLIAQIHGTKTASPVVTEASMLVPEASAASDGATGDDKLPYIPGHYEPGRTIAVHGLVVKPSYQGQSLGTILLKDYIQRLSTLRVADQIALLAHDHLIPFYARQEFVDRGESTVTACGGNWHDLVRELTYTEEYE